MAVSYELMVEIPGQFLPCNAKEAFLAFLANSLANQKHFCIWSGHMPWSGWKANGFTAESFQYFSVIASREDLIKGTENE